ncbi:unnamed protein product [Gordionus sp. m RMFG-2023]
MNYKRLFAITFIMMALLSVMVKADIEENTPTPRIDRLRTKCRTIECYKDGLSSNYDGDTSNITILVYSSPCDKYKTESCNPCVNITCNSNTTLVECEPNYCKGACEAIFKDAITEKFIDCR